MGFMGAKRGAVDSKSNPIIAIVKVKVKVINRRGAETQRGNC
jgi:hypothetical protein